MSEIPQRFAANAASIAKYLTELPRSGTIILMFTGALAAAEPEQQVPATLVADSDALVELRATSPLREAAGLTIEGMVRARKGASAAAEVRQNTDDSRNVVIDYQQMVLEVDRVDGGSYTNKTPFVTWVKGENSDQVYPVAPGVTYPWAIDGFADPVNRPGHVYKIIDGLHAYYEIIEGKPDIDFSADGGLRFLPGYTVAQSFSGGWRDESWLAEKHAGDDNGWDQLFEVSRLNLHPVL